MTKLLFHGQQFHDFAAARVDSAKRWARDLTAGQLTDVQAVVATGLERFALEPMTVDAESIYVAGGVQSSKIDVRSDPLRGVLDQSRPIYVPSIRADLRIPFQGEAAVMRCQPTTYDLNPPYGDVFSDEISIVIERPADVTTMEMLQKEIDHAVSRVSRYVGWLHTDCENFNRSVEQTIRGAVAQRAAQLETAMALTTGLGLPSHRPGTQPSPARPSAPVRSEVISTVPSVQQHGQSKEVDLFISHASEDKDFVRPLAEALRLAGLQVWYDDFELKLGDSIRKSIEHGLSQSRHGLVILSPSFFGKEWPESELSAIVSLARAGQMKILPVWHKLTTDDVVKASPLLADTKAARSGEGIESLVEQIIAVVRPDAAKT